MVGACLVSGDVDSDGLAARRFHRQEISAGLSFSGCGIRSDTRIEHDSAHPTALHLTAIIIGVKGSEQQAVVMDGRLGSTSRKAAVLAGLMTASAVFGSVLFVSTSKKTMSEFAEHKNDMP